MATGNLPPLGLVVGYDGSAGAERALAWAARGAARAGTSVRLVLAVPSGSTGHGDRRVALRASLGDMLDKAAAGVRDTYPGLLVETSMPEAGETPAEALLRAGEAGDQIVIGSRGRGGFAGLLLGSVALRVCAHATCPVVVVPRSPPPRSGDVVVGVADVGDTPALELAAGQARLGDGHVTVVHSWVVPLGGFAQGAVAQPPAGTEELLAVRGAELERIVAPVRDRTPEVTFETVITEDGPAAALVTASADAALVVAAAHRRRGVLPLRLGPTTHALLHHAHCPVAVVPVRRPPKGAHTETARTGGT